MLNLVSEYLLESGCWLYRATWQKRVCLSCSVRREKPSVIMKSVFKVVRHPIYLSEILLYLGLLMLSISLAGFVVLLMAIVFLHYISRHEERILFARFGEEYRKYMQEVPMWIPRLQKR